MNDEIIEILRRALAEDVGSGDVTTESTVASNAEVTGRFISKSTGVVAGWDVVKAAFRLVDDRVMVFQSVSEGAEVRAGETIGTISGPGKAILSGERVALNVFQRMSGIATAARRYVEAVAGTKAVILDTRKTVPGLRMIDKMAVRIGGASNHRSGLYDMVLIKDNHIAQAGGITEAVRRVRESAPKGLTVEVEVSTIEELEEVIPLGIDRVLLDNMDTNKMRRAVKIAAGRVPLEASGNITLRRAAAVAATGVDFISVGALTHSVVAMDISLILDRK